MKKHFFILTGIAIILVAAILSGGCGFVSGTKFIHQEVDGDIVTHVESGSSGPTVNAVDSVLSMGSRVVNISKNDDWKKFAIDGIEDACVRVTVENHLDQNVSGEVWVTPDTAAVYSTPDDVRAHGFRVFHGLALLPNETKLYTCEETLNLLENVDQLVDAVRVGYFRVYGLGDQPNYFLVYSGIVLGVTVTGSLQ